MPKADPTAVAISRIAALKHIDDPNLLSQELSALIGNKTEYVVSRAAELAMDKGVRGVLSAAVASLDRLLHAGKGDVGCMARGALVRLLIKIDADLSAEDVALRAAQCVQWDPGVGGSVDSGVGVRGNAAILLAAMGSTHAVRVATALLAEESMPLPRERRSELVRLDAAKALRMTGADPAAAVLHFKTRIGDESPEVLGECFAGLISIWRSAGLEYVETFLVASAGDAAEVAVAESAMLAIADTRHPQAAEVLRRHADRFLRTPSAPIYLTSLAITRQEAAIAFLLELVRTGARDRRAAAEEALQPVLALPGLREKLAAAKRGARA
jgi:hypothetical protein